MIGLLSPKYYLVTLAMLSLLVVSCDYLNLISSSKNELLTNNNVNHVVVIYLENHSFDNLYGQFPGANGISSANKSAITQVSITGAPYPYLPIKKADETIIKVPNKLYNIDKYIPSNIISPDLAHSYYQEQMAIDGGMDKFVLNNGGEGTTQGYYSTSKLPLSALAQRYTLCDNFFHSAFGGSFLNHIWLISASSPVFPDAPSSIVSTVDPISGVMITDGKVSPDGYVINTSYTVNVPHPTSTPDNELVPNQHMPTIGDRLNEKNITWAWYSGGWDMAISGNPAPSFQFHHQPFAYFANYADGTELKSAHLKDENEFISAAQNGTLPSKILPILRTINAAS